VRKSANSLISDELAPKLNSAPFSEHNQSTINLFGLSIRNARQFGSELARP
jgi:hypothetical protein